MTTTAARTTTYAWILLSAITIVSWWLAPGHTRGAAAVASVPITLAVILLAFIKGRLIIRYFMEVRTAPRWLKLFTDAWLTVAVGRSIGDLPVLKCGYAEAVAPMSMPPRPYRDSARDIPVVPARASAALPSTPRRHTPAVMEASRNIENTTKTSSESGSSLPECLQ